MKDSVLEAVGSPLVRVRSPEGATRLRYDLIW
jgi:hypothetical protein